MGGALGKARKIPGAFVRPLGWIAVHAKGSYKRKMIRLHRMLEPLLRLVGDSKGCCICEVIR